ncbi:MAG: DUF983 domain-containing protein [Alphaproteobacteria bacterium]|nr:DUF983 domain-containing protein [Alphaproteobacteria bacterium]
MLPDKALLDIAWACKCPKCGQGDLYKPGLTLSLRDHCESCGLDLSRNDSADGPAVFLIFILGFLLVPLALLLEVLTHPPLWVHVILWSSLALGVTLGSIRPLKAYIIALQFKHRPGDWA